MLRACGLKELEVLVKILHFSMTPLVGAPGRICEALNMIEGVEARWVVLNSDNYGGLSFRLDWCWERDKNAVIEFFKIADVIHLHNYIDLETKNFSPLSFRDAWLSGRSIVRQFHSTPSFVAKYMGVSERDVLSCPIPKLVVAQFQERFYSDAKIVPNIVFGDALSRPCRTGSLKIGYAPSNFRRARESRWDTKGFHETDKIIRKACRVLRREGCDIDYDLIVNVPHEECILRKKSCDIFVDELVTGSYHLNSLEALALGCVTLAHMDARLVSVVKDLVGCDSFPVLNVRLEELEVVLRALSERPEIVREIGLKAQRWMSENWNPEKMILHYMDSYYYVLANPGKGFPVRFIDDESGGFMRRDIFDLIWCARQKSWPMEMPKLLRSIKATVGGGLRKALRKY